MTALSIQAPFPIITDIDGQPLEDGFIWIGVANLPPIGNPITVYWDAALTQPAALPVRTLGGYPMNSGTPGRLYVNSDYSILVQNKNGSTVYSAPAATERYGNLITFADITGTLGSDRVTFLQAGTGAVTRTAQSKMRDVVSVFDFMTAAQIADVQSNAATIDVTAAIQTAINATKAPVLNGNGYGKSLYFPRGTYLVTDTLLFVDLRGSRYFGEAMGEFGQQGTTIRWAGGNTKPIAKLDFFKGCELADITFATADTTTNRATACLEFAYVSVSGSSGPSQVRHCYFSGAEYGVLLGDLAYNNTYNVSEMYFQNCSFYCRYGVYNAGVPSGGQNVNNVFVACHFNGALLERGVWIDGGNVVLNQCTFNGSASSSNVTAVYMTGDITIGVPVVMRDCYAEQICKTFETEFTAVSSQWNRTGILTIETSFFNCNRVISGTAYFIECYKDLEIEVRDTVIAAGNILYSPPASGAAAGYSSLAPSVRMLRFVGFNPLGGTITTARGGYYLSDDRSIPTVFPFGFLFPNTGTQTMTITPATSIQQMPIYGVYAAYGSNGTFDLATITGGKTGDILHLMGHPTQATYRITVVKNATGNIFTQTGADFTIDTATKKIILQKDVSGNWIETGRISV